jgi:Neprosin
VRVVGAGVQQGRPAVAAAIKPVCPRGKVPVVKGLRRGLPKGNPDQAKPGTHAGTAPQRSAGPSCDGTFEDGFCYYWSGATDYRTDQGGGHTMTIEKPAVVGSGHSLEEMSVQAGKSDGNIVEIGSVITYPAANPQLFVFHWISWNPTCYNGCGYQQYSRTYYPGMDLSSLVGKQVYNGYVFYQGNWWAWFNDQWLGYFPGSLWSGQFQTSQQVQWFGEVATNNGVPPQSSMGDALFAGNVHAAPMSTLCDVNVAAWRCFYYDKQSTYQTDPKFYTVAHTGFGAIRLGGPGS